MNKHGNEGGYTEPQRMIVLLGVGRRDGGLVQTLGVAAIQVHYLLTCMEQLNRHLNECELLALGYTVHEAFPV